MKTLLLIDAHAFIHRSFHALPPLTTPQGEPIGAIYGLSSTLIKELHEHHPDYIAAAFDRPEPTFRKEQFKEYKAHRPPAADELVSQMVRARELFEKFGIPVFEAPGYEADDIIGTFVKRFSKDARIIILTGDLDTLQLVTGDRVVVQAPKRGADLSLYDEKAVMARFGISPERVPDYKGLVGDASDNIPGVKGIGPKGAQKLLQEFGDIETLYKKLSPTDPLAKKLLPQKESAFFSKMLATIKTDVPLDANLNDLVFKGVPDAVLKTYFEELGFQSLVRRLGGDASAESAPMSAPSVPEHIFIDANFDVKKNFAALASKKLKVMHGGKEFTKKCSRAGIEVLGPFFDIEIAGWLLDADKKDFSLSALAKRFLRESQANEQEQIEKLFLFFWKKFREYGLLGVSEKIDMPLIPILARMEETGIGANTNALSSLQNEIAKETDGIVKKIYALAGESFNISSPQQVSRILFDKLALEPGRRRKTGSGHARTSKDVLETLKDKHPVVKLILDYRENTKIATSFVEPLTGLVAADGRIHTTFLQTGTTTGRLASEKPNLQNIPQESKWSSALRNAFVPQNGFSFLSFDYSQLELRLLAEVSGDEKLRTAFKNGEDIHTATASNVFNVPKKDVDASMRRLAKTLNFGVVYGMGSRAFAETSGLSQKDASHFIEEYFNDFPAVKEWQKRVIEEMRTFGYVTNKNGRRRWFLEVLRNPSRGDFERQAINMPIQSLGADILKLAMVETDRIIKERALGRDARLLLSIHDELLFEVRDDILKSILPILKDSMERVYALSVPLIVEAKQGTRWGAMEHIA